MTAHWRATSAINAAGSLLCPAVSHPCINGNPAPPFHTHRSKEGRPPSQSSSHHDQPQFPGKGARQGERYDAPLQLGRRAELWAEYERCVLSRHLQERTAALCTPLTRRECGGALAHRYCDRRTYDEQHLATVFQEVRSTQPSRVALLLCRHPLRCVGVLSMVRCAVVYCGALPVGGLIAQEAAYRMHMADHDIPPGEPRLIARWQQACGATYNIKCDGVDTRTLPLHWLWLLLCSKRLYCQHCWGVAASRQWSRAMPRLSMLCRHSRTKFLRCWMYVAGWAGWALRWLSCPDLHIALTHPMLCSTFVTVWTICAHGSPPSNITHQL